MEPLPHTRSCLVCGIENPSGHRLRMETDGRRVRTRFRFRDDHTGFRGVVHGGATATILDEVMAWVIGVSARRFAFCAEMGVRYRHPVHPGVELTAWAEVVENRRGRVFMARACLEDAGGVVLAEATGKYLPIPGDAHAVMMEDFAEPPGRWLDGSSDLPASPSDSGL